MNYNIDFYVALCEEFGIDEDSMELYSSNDQVINEQSYAEYVQKCKEKHKIPKSPEEYYSLKEKIKKGIIAGASLAAAGIIAHGVAKNAGYKGVGDALHKNLQKRDKIKAQSDKSYRKYLKQEKKEAEKAKKDKAKAERKAEKKLYGPSVIERINPRSEYNREERDLKRELRNDERNHRRETSYWKHQNIRDWGNRQRALRSADWNREDSVKHTIGNIQDNNLIDTTIKRNWGDSLALLSKEPDPRTGISPYERAYNRYAQQVRSNLLNEEEQLYNEAYDYFLAKYAEAYGLND